MIIKIQIILYMYDDFINGKKIAINDIINKYEISIRTFQRYIAELNAFLFNKYKNQVIVYDYENKEYYLSDKLITKNRRVNI